MQRDLLTLARKGCVLHSPRTSLFHVEFGLNKGFVQVIDDERQFKSNFGLTSSEVYWDCQMKTYRRRKQESMETQRQAVAS